MVSFNETDLQVISVENDFEESTTFYLLVLAQSSAGLNARKLLDALQDLEASDKSDGQKDEDYVNLLEQMGIIEIFDQDEVEDLTEDGLIDPEDLHYSIYQIVADEQDD